MVDDQVGGLVVIRLSSSRWHCDAPAAAWMRGWMASTGVEVVGAGELRCLTPPELRGRSLLTLADWELDGDLPTAQIMFRPVPTTSRPGPQHPTIGYDRSVLDWGPAGLDDYADSMEINFQSAIYDDDDDDEGGGGGGGMPDATYDLEDKRSRGDVMTELEQTSSTTSRFTRRPPPPHLKVPDVHRQLQAANTNTTAASPPPSTTTTRTEEYFTAPETETRRATTSGRDGGVHSYVALLATLTMIATVVVVVVVVVAMVMMTRRIEMRRRRTSIELKPRVNGVTQNGAASSATHRSLTTNTENGPTTDEVGRPRVPLVGFTDQVGGEVDDVNTASSTGLSSCDQM